MKINYKMLVAMLQEELACVHADLNTTISDLETEERIQNRLQVETIRLSENNRELILNEIELKKQIIELNTDFFVLGDLFLQATKESQPEKKLEDVATGLDEFLQKQYQSRIEHLEEIIFELGDDLDEQTRVNMEVVYADKKCKYDLEQKILVLEKENKNLKVGLAKYQQQTFEEDRKQIVEEIEKEDVSDPEKKSVTARELAKKHLGKAQGKDMMLNIKNKLCNKGYEVQDTGMSLLAKKPGNRHIEVKPAELPGSFKIYYLWPDMLRI